jgi:hypothetical protein
MAPHHLMTSILAQPITSLFLKPFHRLCFCVKRFNLNDSINLFLLLTLTRVYTELFTLRVLFCSGAAYDPHLRHRLFISRKTLRI